MTLSPDLLERSWGLAPTQAMQGRDTAISAALWGETQGKGREIWAEPDPKIHLVSLPTLPFDVDVVLDGRLVAQGPWRPWGAMIAQAGRRPEATFHSAQWQTLHIYLPRSLVAETAGLDADRLELIDPCGRHDPQLEALGQSVVRELHLRDQLSALEIDHVGLSLSSHILRSWSNMSERLKLKFEVPQAGRPRTGLARWQVERVVEIMGARLNDTVSLDDLARAVHLSPFHFARAFKQATGLPPHRYHMMLRIKKAKDLLAKTRLTMSELAGAVGYEDQSYFARLFRRQTGLTPSAFRKQAKL